MADVGDSVPVDPVDEELSIGGRRLPRRLVRAVTAALAVALAAAALVLAAQPDVAAGHGSVAAATAERYHAEHIGSRPAGKAIRGYFLL
jgi:ferric-dicitrate binding protein FerR (iron transport regulator)